MGNWDRVNISSFHFIYFHSDLIFFRSSISSFLFSFRSSFPSHFLRSSCLLPLFLRCIVYFVCHLLLLRQTVAVECQDNGNPPYSVKRNFSVQLSDVNEAPFDIRLNSSDVVEENVQMDYVIGPLTCKDPDIGQSHVFTVIGNYSSVFQVRIVCLDRGSFESARLRKYVELTKMLSFPFVF